MVAIAAAAKTCAIARRDSADGVLDGIVGEAFSIFIGLASRSFQVTCALPLRALRP